VRRVPQLVVEIRRSFGDGAIRVTRTHAKFATVANADWQVAIRSSISLNQDPRLESFELGHDPELCAWLENLMYPRQPPWSSANFIVSEQAAFSISSAIPAGSSQPAWVHFYRLASGFSWVG